MLVDPPAQAVELGAFFDHEGGGGELAADVCGAAEDELFAREDVALDGAIYFRYCDFNHSLRHFRAGADDECAVRGNHVAGKVPVDPQHRFEADFAGEIHHITHKTQPIVFVDVRPVAINERRLAAFVSARNCLRSHCCCPSFFFSCDPLITFRWDRSRRGAAAAAC